MDLKNQTQKRPIKFRARCAFSGVWRYGFYYVSKGNHIIRDENDKESIVLEKTLGQSTGLHDINGKEIYEGDIVRWGMHGGSWGHEIWNRYAKVEINPDLQFRIIHYIHSETGEKIPTDNYIFHFGKFAYKETDKHIEIIGNIFENADLVKL